MKSEMLTRPPVRSSRAGSALVAGSVLLFSAIVLLPGIRPWATLTAFLLAGAALCAAQPGAFLFSLLTALVSGAPLLHPLLRDWPLNLLAPFVFYCAIMVSVRRLRFGLGWIRAGAMGRNILFLVIVIALASGIGLVAWYRIAQPDLSVHLRFMPDIPIRLLPLAGLGFAAGNAALEEFVFRGAIMQSLDSAFPAALSTILQAWLFGAAHYARGFPNGWPGVILAGVYGFMLGRLRRRSGGMLAPWLAHACADLVIFAILAESS